MRRIADSIKNANKAAKNAERMEAQFTVNEESINDLVQHAVQREFSKLRPFSLPAKTPPAPVKPLEAVGMNDPVPQTAANAVI